MMSRARRGFTLIELMVAGMMTSIVLGGITTSLSQLGSAKSISRQRLEAYSRCDTALRTIRKEAISVLRRDDLFDTRILISDFTDRYLGEDVDRDELLVFNGNLRANKEIDFNGEGLEYETQLRIENNDVSSALWKRRDAILDDNPVGGGMVTPVANGIVSLQLEAFDGAVWFAEWDSDELGIPMAIRITVTATGMEFINELDTSLVTLRTVVPLDRVMPPADLFAPVDQTDDEEGQGEEDEDLGGGSTGSADGEGESGGGESGDSSDGPGGSGGSGAGGIESGNGGGNSGGENNTGGGGKDGPGSITDPDGNVHKLPG
jgi:type II secretory pathway pseudopilin PulG